MHTPQGFVAARGGDTASDWQMDMAPVLIGGCFGWLHSPSGGRTARVCVVLCQGTESDAETGYRSFRVLAAALASAGYPALRFDYPGTGNSRELANRDHPGADVGIDHWAAREQSVHAAADWLLGCTGADRVVFCGLRLGATLAAVAGASREDLAGLILIAPVFSGRSILRQSSVLATLRRPDGDGEPLTPWTGQSAEALAMVELQRLRFNQACRIALRARPSPALATCTAAWRGQGLAVTCNELGELEPMLRVAFMNHARQIEASAVIAWLQREVPPWTRAQPLAYPSQPAVLDGPTWTETPLRFGSGRRLFGVLCRQRCAGGVERADLAVVIGNAGGLPHSAPATVAISRDLARAGIATLRIDFAGCADSLAPGDAASHIFEVNRDRDFGAAIDLLQELGYRRFALSGICSGAYHAWRAASVDTRVGKLLLVNLPAVEWRSGTPVEHLQHVIPGPAHIVRKIADRSHWRDLLHGNLALRSRLAALSIWGGERIQASWRKLAARLSIPQPRTNVQRAAHALAARAQVLLLFSPGDAGLARLKAAFAPCEPPPEFEVQILAEADHALLSRASQRAAAAAFIDAIRLHDSASEIPVSHVGHECPACYRDEAPIASAGPGCVRVAAGEQQGG